MAAPEFTFGLPPSLGREPVFEMAREFADVLFAARFTTVVPYKSYEALQQALISREIDAAWGPPLICARIEAAGGTIAQRAIRNGAVTYRSALVARAMDRWSVAMITSGAFRPRVAWVDEWSMAGYLLPRALMRREGIDLATSVLSEKTYGSYQACFAAVREFDADLTAAFVGAKGFTATWGPRADRLQALAYSDETPNDGVVIAPELPAERRQHLEDNLVQLLADAHAHKVLCAQFQVDGFDRPPRETYTPLLALVSA